jgi:membrane protein DedA with SNARE-associated domain
VLTFAGSLIWDTGLAYAGYGLGRNFDRVASFLRDGGYLLAVAILVAVAVWWLRGRRAESPADVIS